MNNLEVLKLVRWESEVLMVLVSGRDVDGTSASPLRKNRKWMRLTELGNLWTVAWKRIRDERTTVGAEDRG